MRTFTSIAAACFAGVALGGCVIVDADVSEAHWDRDHDFGYVLSAEVNARAPEVSITAHSNGCTQKEDFDPVVRDRGEDRFDVGFRRHKPDNCKALMPDGRTMVWTFAELGIPRNARVVVLNPVGRP